MKSKIGAISGTTKWFKNLKNIGDSVKDGMIHDSSETNEGV